jgi:hypothetical protein
MPSVRNEFVRCQYLQEEDFLADYLGLAEAVAQHLGGDWRPDFRCNGWTRESRARALAGGRLSELTFHFATIFHNAAGLSSYQVHLRSSSRTVVVRVAWWDGETRLEVILDTMPVRR